MVTVSEHTGWKNTRHSHHILVFCKEHSRMLSIMGFFQEKHRAPCEGTQHQTFVPQPCLRDQPNGSYSNHLSSLHPVIYLDSAPMHMFSSRSSTHSPYTDITIGETTEAPRWLNKLRSEHHMPSPPQCQRVSASSVQLLE